MERKSTFPLNIIVHIHKLSRDFINRYHKDEIIYFDSIWEIYEPELKRWEDKPPDRWRFKIPKHKLMGALGFADVSQALDLVTPAIITTLSATMIAIRDLGYIPKDEEVHKIIDKYAPAFGARGILVNLMKRYFKDLCETLPEILEEKKEKKEFVPSTISKVDSFARVWTLKTKDPENGEIISKEKYENILKNEEYIPLLITKSNGIRTIFVYGNAKTLSPLRFDLLEYFLKNRGHGGDLINLLEKVWKNKELAKNLRKEVDSDLIRERTSNIRGEISDFNKFLLDNLDVEIKSHRKGQYKFTCELEYYLIEIL